VAHVALRNALVREVNHRIKNSLQGVTGLLARHGYANPDMMPVLNQAITQILSVATIHGLQGQSGSRDLNLLELIESIAQHIRQIWDHSVTVDCLAGLRNWHINPKEAVPVALILNELLANAAKHVDPRAPGLSVHGALDRDRKTLRISIANRVRDGARFNDAAGCGVGLQLVDSLLPRVGATLKAGLVGQQFEAVLELGAPVVSEQTSH
jgi:two-component sensor histidine kinase